MTVRSGGRLIDGIGTLSEKTVHAILKNYFEPFTDSQEQKIGGFVADIAGENGIIEIQTADFGKMRKKLETFLSVSPVTIVHPVYSKTKIFRLSNETGEVISKRVSPVKENFYSIFPELYKIKSFLKNENLSFHFVMLEADEYRIADAVNKPKRSGKSYAKFDRIPTEFTDELIIERPSDYLYYIPEELRSCEFTSRDLAAKAKINLSLAQLALNILTYLNVTEKTGARNRYYLYKVSDQSLTTTEIL